MRIFILISASFFITNCQFSNPLRQTASDRMVLDKSGYIYDPNDKSCDGYPRLRVQTKPGTCLGLVLPQNRAIDKSSGKALIMPRTLVPVPNSENFILADMGHWKMKDGALYLLKKNQNQYDLKLLKGALENPHGLEFGPDGFLYVGEKQQITRFKFENEVLGSAQLILGDFAKILGHSHPLTQFTFDPRNGDLIINLGSESDACRANIRLGTDKACEEDLGKGLASIIRIPAELMKYLQPEGVYKYQLIAYGLRNSMALVVHPSGTIVQGENGRDFKESEEPYEEINVIEPEQRGFHYGWPYCYNFHATSPEWLFPENARLPLVQQFKKPVDCNAKDPKEIGDYQTPWALMPPHVAPLHARYYKGKMFSDILDGKLLMTWHGYAATGHRLVAYNVDAKGRPVISTSLDQAKYSFDQERGCAAPIQFKPRGGMERFAPYEEIISQWNDIPGVRSKGTPVGFAIANDGSIFIAEDKTKRVIVRLAKDNSSLPAEDCQKQGVTADDPTIRYLTWRNYLKSDAAAAEAFKKIDGQLISKYCTSCHGSFVDNPVLNDGYAHLDYLVRNRWIIPGDLVASKFYGSIAQSGEFKPMPPIDATQFYGSAHGTDLITTVGDWISKMPVDLEKHAVKITMGSARKIRFTPAADGLACGQFEANENIYVDPRSETRTTNAGWLWTKVYVVPGSTRLFPKACPYPADGVFYLALKKL